jgi:hypothetical protein
MKRTILALGIVAALLILAIVAWPLLQKGRETVETSPASAADPVDETAVPDGGEMNTAGTSAAETAALPALPPLTSEQAGGGPGPMGLGGGGPQAQPPEAPEAAGESGDATVIVAPVVHDFFAGVSFSLEASLPAEPAEAEVQRQTLSNIDLAQARDIADQFGFSGPLYVQEFPEYGTGPASENVAPAEPPLNFYTFEGAHYLSIQGSGFAYINPDVTVDYDQSMVADVSRAERFLQERDLLDFPYVAEMGFNQGEVLFLRLVDGVPLRNRPEFSLQFGNDGEIAFASNGQFASEIETVGTYPLRSAESAWQLILDGVTANRIAFNIVPDFDRMPQSPEPSSEPPQFWPRTYQPGQEAHLYMMTTVYRAAEGDGVPLVRMGEFTLHASGDTLHAIADQVNETVHVWGQIGSDGKTMEVTGWEAVPEMTPLYLEGTVQRQEDQTLLSSNTGDTFILPHAPDGLPDGLEVFVFAWTSRDVGQAYPALDWQNIDEKKAMEPVSAEPGPVADAPAFDPYTFAQVTINQVEFAYYYSPVFAEGNRPVVGYEPPPGLLQPVWKFAGVTDNGDTIELFVRAVAPEYLETP